MTDLTNDPWLFPPLPVTLNGEVVSANFYPDGERVDSPFMEVTVRVPQARIGQWQATLVLLPPTAQAPA